MHPSPMPIHDWSKIYAGAFHDLHITWLVELKRVLNQGLLPPGYYALGEQVIGGAVPDVLTLDQGGLPAPSEPAPAVQATGEVMEPTATITAVAETPRYPPRPRVIAVRHVSGDRLVAMIEIVSAGSKSDAADLGSLVEKTVVALSKGDRLPDAPLFLTPALFVSLPLEATYQAAFDALPGHLRADLAGR